jgi:hypothetical protein
MATLALTDGALPRALSFIASIVGGVTVTPAAVSLGLHQNYLHYHQNEATTNFPPNSLSRALVHT